ncbi:HAMP domain-containing sensor histidine kinase [Citromicrobium bathyomarinum]|uniref:sensor histidine kinase n=1 Tax=Citromicrobium bathyomarinum TaxID=72174 RepID=UPI00315B0C32
MWLAIALSVLLVFCLWAMTDQTIRAANRASVEEAVDVDLAGLVDIYASGDQGELERRIADRLAITPAGRSEPHYLLTDGEGSVIVGDLDRWPDLDPKVSELGAVTVLDGLPVLARATQLGPDLRLVVAYERDQADPVLHRVAWLFLLGGTIFVLLVGLFGRHAARGLQSRIEQINAAFRTPESVPVIATPSPTGRRDEIDELADHSTRALQRVSRLLAAYRETTDQLAHEIRTPIMHLDQRLVKALAEPLPASVSEKLIEARAEIRRIVSMLESLLDIASSKARKGDRHGLAPVNLSELATRICNLYADSAEESNHSFVWDIAPGVCLDGEESQLTRLMTNLLDNAFKYVPEGGKITLTLRPGPVLTVADDGPGVPPNHAERIFERFYRGDGREAGQTGSGLGLALARAIAERHGLTITLEPVDKGASFRVGRETE